MCSRTAREDAADAWLGEHGDALVNIAVTGPELRVPARVFYAQYRLAGS
jgi:hypothetical protein